MSKPTDSQHSTAFWKTAARLLPFVKPHGFWLSISISIAVSRVFQNIAFTYLIKHLTDSALAQQQERFLEFHRRGARGPAFGRTAAASGHRASPAEGCPHPVAGRGYFGTRLRIRAAGPGCFRGFDGGTHGPGHRPSAVDDRTRGRHICNRQGRGSRAGSARRSTGPRQALQESVRRAIQRE